MRSDNADTRAAYEREIAVYLESPRQIADLRRLCLRVAHNGHKKGFVAGFVEGQLHQLLKRGQ
jgi:hypothetical protein